MFFSVMMAAQNTLKMPAKPSSDDHSPLIGPQKVLFIIFALFQQNMYCSKQMGSDTSETNKSWKKYHMCLNSDLDNFLKYLLILAPDTNT